MDKDLYDMASEINAAVSDATIKTKAQAVMNAFGSTVLWQGHTNAYSDVHGMTIYHIGKASEKDSNYTYYRSTISRAHDELGRVPERLRAVTHSVPVRVAATTITVTRIPSAGPTDSDR
jgi:hypothetical protein